VEIGVAFSVKVFKFYLKQDFHGDVVVQLPSRCMHLHSVA